MTERPHWARTLLLSCAGDSPWESPSRWPASWASAEAGPAASPGLETTASPQMAPRGASPGPFFLAHTGCSVRLRAGGLSLAVFSYPSDIQLFLGEEARIWQLLDLDSRKPLPDSCLFPISKSACMLSTGLRKSACHSRVSLLLSSLCHPAHCWSGRKTWDLSGEGARCGRVPGSSLLGTPPQPG